MYLKSKSDYQIITIDIHLSKKQIISRSSSYVVGDIGL